MAHAKLPRNVFVRCGACGFVFLNRVRSGAFCQRCRGTQLAVVQSG